MSADIDEELLREVMTDLTSTEDLPSIPSEEYSNVPWKPPDEAIPHVIPDPISPNNTNGGGLPNANQTIIIIPTLSVTGDVNYVLIIKKGGDSENSGELIVTRTESTPADLRDQLCKNVGIEEAQITDGSPIFEGGRLLEEGEIIEEDEIMDTPPIFHETPLFQESPIFQESTLNDPQSLIIEKGPMITEADQMDVNSIDVNQILELEKLPERKGVWYECDRCDFSHKKKCLTIRHMRTHSDSRPYICHLCQRAFKCPTSLSSHLIVHSGTKPNSCKFCTSTFITSGELLRHIRYRHYEDKSHKCEYCDYTSDEVYKVRRHALQHSAGFTFKCGYCSFAAVNKNKLKDHLRIHSTNKPPKVHECKVCHLSNMSFQELQKHKLTHCFDDYCPKYPCKLCSISFSSRRDLNAHIQQMHFSLKPLKCTLCEDTFPDLHTYKVHFSNHGKSNTLKCDKCSFSTSSLRYLQNHQILHEGEKLYYCEECAQSFPEMFLLNRHRKRSHKNNDSVSILGANHKCSECGRQFLQKEHFINHMTIHNSLTDSYPEMFSQKKIQKKGQPSTATIWEI